MSCVIGSTLSHSSTPINSHFNIPEGCDNIWQRLGNKKEQGRLALLF
jgi:hypothetical protein